MKVEEYMEELAGQIRDSQARAFVSDVILRIRQKNTKMRALAAKNPC